MVSVQKGLDKSSVCTQPSMNATEICMTLNEKEKVYKKQLVITYPKKVQYINTAMT